MQKSESVSRSLFNTKVYGVFMDNKVQLMKPKPLFVASPGKVYEDSDDSIELKKRNTILKG